MTVTVGEAMDQLVSALYAVEESERANDAFLAAHKAVGEADALQELRQKEAEEASEENKAVTLQLLKAAILDAFAKRQQRDAALDDAKKKSELRDNAAKLGMAMKDAALRKK